MLSFDDKGGVGGQKNPKTCLLNTWMFPNMLMFLLFRLYLKKKVELHFLFFLSVPVVKVVT